MRHSIAFVVSVLVCVLFVGGCSIKQKGQEVINAGRDSVGDSLGTPALNIKATAEKDLAIAQAKELFRAQSLDGKNFTNGPCLSNSLFPGWVADIVHDPRTSVDDDTANQCEAFVKGTAKHFVELDLEGNFIRAQ